MARLLFPLVAVLFALAASTGVGHARVLPHRCGARRGALDYGWPVLPFDRQHPIRGGFGDPRTVSQGRFGRDDNGDPGAYSFHNGVDIAAHEWTVVYPVVSGRARVVDADQIDVEAKGRVFQYFHLSALVRTGERVVADETPLGIVTAARHVHLSEIDGGRIVNPLLHLRPYTDATVPVLRGLHVADRGGHLAMTVEAYDAAPMRVPGTWADFPLVPALVRSTLTAANGRVVWRRTAADFRRTEPPRRDFWRVYGDGTYQNFPVFGFRYFWRRPGRYVFRLTDQPIDTRRLADGRYTVRVVAADECGNEGTLTRSVRIVDGVR